MMATSSSNTASNKSIDNKKPLIPRSYIWSLYSTGFLYSFLDYVQNGLNFSHERFSTLLIWEYIAVLTLAIPLSVYLISIIIERINPKLDNILRLNLILLTGYVCIRTFLGNGIGSVLSPEVLCGLSLGLTFLIPFSLRFQVIREFYNIQRIGIVLVPLVMIVFTDMAQLAFPRQDYPVGQYASEATQHPPVILIILDELPSLSVLKTPQTLDSDWLPNLAALSSQADFFPNTLSHSGATVQSLPSILTGIRPQMDSEKGLAQCAHRPPVLSLMPKHLYQWFEADRIIAHENHTRLCPNHDCEESLYQSEPRIMFRLIYRLFWQQYIPSITTPDFLQHVRLIPEADLNQPEWAHRPSNLLQAETSPMARDIAFVNTLNLQKQPVDLLVFHPLLPHNPFLMSPDGRFIRHYSTLENAAAHPCRIPGNAPSDVCLPPALAQTSRQRHLYQLKATDALLGDIIKKLKASGQYDKALIIVTADHGIAFQSDTPVRALNKKTAAAIIPVPLWVKYPHQSTPHTYLETRWLSDITPTILKEIGVPAHRYQALDGKPLQTRLPQNSRTDATYACYEKDALLFSPSALLRERDQQLITIAKDMPPTHRNPTRRLSQNPAKNPDLGQPETGVRLGPESELKLLSPRVWTQPKTTTKHSLVPLVVDGTFSSAKLQAKAARPPDVAIIVNGRIEAIASPFRLTADPGKVGPWVFSAVVPEAAFRTGVNHITARPYAAPSETK